MCVYPQLRELLEQMQEHQQKPPPRAKDTGPDDNDERLPLPEVIQQVIAEQAALAWQQHDEFQQYLAQLHAQHAPPEMIAQQCSVFQQLQMQHAQVSSYFVLFEHIYVYTYRNAYIRIYIRIYIYTYIHTYTRMDACMHVYTYIRSVCC